MFKEAQEWQVQRNLETSTEEKETTETEEEDDRHEDQKIRTNSNDRQELEKKGATKETTVQAEIRQEAKEVTGLGNCGATAKRTNKGKW
ncbi:hypothetical protein R1flu_007900 [Riccia fluitans]|uniref:Uncharacterized protein n=1 Tax=Riccia fluitans TaxID=41844 RepID=A0ABD1Z056_9MARC